MSSQQSLNSAERELEAALGGLTPAAAGVDRDRLQFRAGMAVGQRRCRVWQSTTAAMTGLAAVAWMCLFLPRPFEVVETVPSGPQKTTRIVQTTPPRAAPLPLEVRLVEARYVSLREAVLERGIDALPRPTTHAHSAGSVPLLSEETGNLPLRYRQALPRLDSSYRRASGDGA